MKYLKIFEAYINIPEEEYNKKSIPNPWKKDIELSDLEFRVPKEYHRTAGFKYSKPHNKYIAKIKCDFPKGSSGYVRVAVLHMFDDMKLSNADLTIKRNEQEENKDQTYIYLYKEELLPERTLIIKFDAYSENEAEYIVLEILENLTKELEIIANPTIKIQGSRYNKKGIKKMIGFKDFNTPRKLKKYNFS